MMKNLLRQFIGNYKKDHLYDRVIDEFQSLVNLRNDYIHGLWWTFEDERVFLQVENVNQQSFKNLREIKIEELTSFLARASALRGLISQIVTKEYEASEEKKKIDAQIAASAQKSP